MVTGAYYPELSGASLQCRALMRALADRVSFAVFTTTIDRGLPRTATVDGVPIRRVPVDPNRLSSKLRASSAMIRGFAAAAAGRDIVHFHGFSQKTVPLVALARVGRKHLVMKQTSIGHDDAVSLAERGMLARWTARRIDCLVAPSPAFAVRHAQGPFARTPLRVIPNGVDTRRFAPADAHARAAARRALGLPEHARVVLHVGFFSREKAVDLLFDAWARTAARWTDSVLVLVGATQPGHGEIDPAIAPRVREDARRHGLASRVVFVERTDDIDTYYRAADLFVLASLREGLPNVLLEAMATGVASIASRLPGVTDSVITDGVDGLLVPPGDRARLEAAIDSLLADPSRAATLGAAARCTIETRYAMPAVADAYAKLYEEILGRCAE